MDAGSPEGRAPAGSRKGEPGPHAGRRTLNPGPLTLAKAPGRPTAVSPKATCPRTLDARVVTWSEPEPSAGTILCSGEIGRGWTRSPVRSFLPNEPPDRCSHLPIRWPAVQARLSVWVAPSLCSGGVAALTLSAKRPSWPGAAHPFAGEALINRHLRLFAG